jgi:hypothetical protein
VESLLKYIKKHIPNEHILKIFNSVHSTLNIKKTEGISEKENARVLVLSALICEEIKQKNFRWDNNIVKITEIAKPMRSHLVLIEEISYALNIDIESVTKDISKLDRIRTKAIAFEIAIVPRKLSSLTKDHKVFKERVSVFLERERLSDCDVVNNARQIFEQERGIGSENIDRLLRLVPVQRLRTYPNNLMQKVARNYANWKPIVHFIEGRLSGDKAKSFKKEFDKLLQGLTRSLKKLWPDDIHGYTTLDAINDVINHEFSSDKRQRKYTYEGDFVGWVFKAANNRLKSEYQKWKHRGEFITDEDFRKTPSNPQLLSEDDHLEVIQRLNQQYLFVEHFFDKKNHGRVKEIWSSLLHMDEMSDKELADLIKEKYGEVISVNTLVTTRRRLYKRYYALAIILHYDFNEYLPRDASLLMRIHCKWTLDDKDITTLRQIIALSRASKDEGTLGWALFSYLFVHKVMPIDEVFTKVKPFLEFHGKYTSENTDTRLNKARQWMKNQRYIKTLKELRHDTGSNKVSFFLSSCWYLAVLRNMSIQDIISILIPNFLLSSRDDFKKLRKIKDELQKLDDIVFSYLCEPSYKNIIRLRESDEKPYISSQEFQPAINELDEIMSNEKCWITRIVNKLKSIQGLSNECK